MILSGCKAVYRLLMLTTVSAGRRGAVDVKTPTGVYTCQFTHTFSNWMISHSHQSQFLVYWIFFKYTMSLFLCSLIFCSAFSEHCSSSSSNWDLRHQIGRDKKMKPLTSTITPGSNKTLHYDKNRNLDFFSLTSACAVPSEFPMPACGTTTLNHSKVKLK